MKLCHYFKAKHGLDLLRTRCIKITNPNDFNDPFEFYPYVDGKPSYSIFKKYLKTKPVIDKFYERYKILWSVPNKKVFKIMLKNKENIRSLFDKQVFLPKQLNETFYKVKEKSRKHLRVICFSQYDDVSPYDEILMWSHYAERHDGVRIVFSKEKLDFKKGTRGKINYQPMRKRIDINDFMFRSSKVSEAMYDSIFIKSDSWEYEKEYRWIIDPSDWCKESNSPSTIDFAKIPAEAITQVDIGARAPESLTISILKELGNARYKHIILCKASLDEKEFKLNYELINRGPNEDA